MIKGTVDIQGLVALSQNKDFQAVYIAWMCSAPQNNKLLCDNPKYSGVGGHLFAIAADKSVEYGFGGTIVGYAANMDLVNIIIAASLKQSILQCFIRFKLQFMRKMQQS